MTRVMIVSDEDFFRIGLRHALGGETDLEIRDCDLNEQSVLEAIEEHAPQIVLLCCNLDNHWGLRLSRAIAQKNHDARLVIVSENQYDAELFQVIKASAAACLSRKTTRKELVETIRWASRHPAEDRPGANYGPLAEIRKLSDAMAPQAPGNVVVRLTNRETETLQLVAEGRTNKEIGDELGISEQTIKCHVSAILRKLNANDRAHAVALGMRLCGPAAN